MRNFVNLGNFKGIVASVDPALLPQNVASDALNVHTNNGALKPRAGWRNVGTGLASATGINGFFLARGYTGSAFEEEYILVGEAGGLRTAHSVNVSTGVSTQIQNNGGNVALANKVWQGFTFDAIAYLYPYTGAPYYSSVGNDDELVAVDQNRPSDGSLPIQTVWDADADYENNSAATSVDWTGATAGDLTALNDTAQRTTTFNSVVGTTVLIDHFSEIAGTTGKTFNYELEFPAGSTDLSAADQFQMVISWPTSDYKLYGVTATLKDATANELDFEVSVVTGLTSVYLTFDIPEGTDMSEFDDALKLELSYLFHLRTGIGDTNETVTVNPLVPYTSGTTLPTSASGAAKKMKFGVAYLDSRRGATSENPLATTWFMGDSPSEYYNEAGSVFLGNTPTIITNVPNEDYITHAQFLVYFEEDGYWLQISETEVTPNTEIELTTSLTVAQLQDSLDRWNAIAAEPIGEVSAAFPYKGWVVWCGKDGKIRHTQIGNPLRVARLSDDLNSTIRGATFQLTDDYSDYAVSVFDAGQGIIYLGTRGAYYHTGNSPIGMTPIVRLAQHKGTYGPRCACRFRDGSGNIGVAYITDALDVYFIQATQISPNGEYGYQLQEIGDRIRGLIKDFLGGGSLPDANKLFMMADDREDALFIGYGKKMIVLSQRSVADGERHYWPWSFTLGAGTWDAFFSDPTWGIRAVRSSGAIDEFLRNSTSSFALIEGAARDNSAAMPSPYWQSAEMAGEYRRPFQIDVDKADVSDALTITVYYDSSNEVVSLATNKRQVRVPHNVIGNNFKFKVALPQDCEGVRLMVIEEYAKGHRRRL